VAIKSRVRKRLGLHRAVAAVDRYRHRGHKRQRKVRGRRLIWSVGEQQEHSHGKVR